MGLLDFSGFVGDDTAKDEYGLTQADRRQPLWSGLFKAGMLGMAAGENITPGQRAQLMANMGGAIAGIPEARNQQMAEAAQMQLRRQQFTTNQQKLEQQRKVQAYATSPEGQQALSPLSPPIQFAAKAALEAGDIDSFQRIITGAGAEAHRQKMETLAERRVGIQEEKADRKEREQQENPFGNTYEGRMYNVLLRGKRDPKFAESDEYAAAWNHFNRDQRPVAVGNTTIVEPKLSNIGDFPPPGAKPAPTSPTATTPKLPPPAPNEVIENPANQSKRFLNPNNPNEVITEFSDGSATVTDLEGKDVRKEPAAKVDEVITRKWNDGKEAKAKVDVASADFLKEWQSATTWDIAEAIAGRPSKVGAAWANLAALIKETQIYNLGVLNGGDRQFITQAVADPTQIKSLGTKPEIIQAQVQKILNILDAGIKERGRQAQPKSRVPQTAAAGGGGGKGKRTIDRWNAEKGKFEQVEVD